MSKKQKPKDKKHNSNQEIDNSNKQSSGISSPKEKPLSNTPSKNNDIKVNRLNHKILIWINIGMLLSFIVFNYYLISNSERNARAELRAYMQVNETRFTELKVGYKTQVVFEYENVGKSPAYNVAIIGYLKAGGTGMYDADVDSMNARTPSTNWFIGTNIKHSGISTFDKILTKEDSAAYINGTKFCGFMGKITYEDIFGQSHFTLFCYRYNPGTGKFEFYNKFNDADRKPYD